MPKSNIDYDKINDMLDMSTSDKSKYCYHCRSLKDSTKRFKSTISVAHEDDYHNQMLKCTKCGKEFPLYILDVKNFVQLAARLSTDISALLEEYKVLVSCLPGGKITNEDIQNIKDIITASDYMDKIYTSCEELATRVADESTIDTKEDSLLHRSAFYYNHPEY